MGGGGGGNTLEKNILGGDFFASFESVFPVFFFCHNLCQGGYVQVFVCLSF